MARCCNRVVAMLLLIVAAVQVTAVCFVIFKREIPVPGPLSQAIATQLVPEDWDARWNDIRFDLLGGVRASGLRITDRITGSWILEFENIWIDIDIWEILTGQGPGLDRISLSNGRMNAPAMLTRSGVDETLLAQLSTDIEMGSDWLQINHLQFRVEDHWVLLSSPEPLELDWSRERPAESLPERLRRAVVRIRNAADELPSMSSARLNGHLVAKNRDSWELSARATMDWLRIPIARQSSTAESIQLELTDIRWDDGQLSGEAHLYSSRIDIPAFDSQIDSLSLRIPRFSYRSREDWETSPIQLRARSTDTPWANLDTLVAEATAQAGNPLFQGNLRFHYGDSAIHADAELSTRDLSGEFRINSRFRDLTPLLSNVPKPDWIAHVPTTAGPIRLQADVHLDPGAELRRIDWQASMRDLRYQETVFPFVRAHGYSTTQRTQISNAAAWISPSEQVSLSYDQQHPEPAFTLSAVGHSRQQHLDPILDFPWWNNLWDHVSSEEEIVFADVRVEGIWGELNQIWSWVGIVAGNSRFRDLPLKRLDLSLAQAPGKIDLYRLDGETAGAHFDGSLHWRLPLRKDRDEQLPSDQFFRINGAMPVEELRLLTGDRFEWLDDIASERPPKLDFYMERLHDSVGPEHQRATVSIRSEAPLTAFGLPLQQIHTLARQEPGRIHLAPTYARFMNGDVWLDLELEDLQAEHPLFNLQLAARKVEHVPMLNLFRQQFLDRNEDELEEVTETPGLHDADLQLGGRFGDIASYAGGGSNQISEAELGKVRLFGELSRLFDSVGLPFTSLELDAAEATWTLADSKLDLPWVRIDGSAIRLTASGDVQLPENELDFIVQAFVIRGLFGLVFRPMNLVLEFRLGGQLAEPNWSLRINPFRWIGGAGDS